MRSRTRSIPARPPRWMLLAPALLLLLVAACNDDDEFGDDPGADPLATVIEIQVLDDRLDPEQIRLQIPDRHRLVVNNDSGSPCEFFLGPYVRGLTVQPQDSVEMGFTAFAVDVNLAENGPLEMGCAEDERSGTIELLETTTITD